MRIQSIKLHLSFGVRPTNKQLHRRRYGEDSIVCESRVRPEEREPGGSVVAEFVGRTYDVADERAEHGTIHNSCLMMDDEQLREARLMTHDV